MRVYNGTNSQLNLPLSGIQRITIPAHSVSGDIMPSTEFLSLLVGSYDYSEIALIVSGPFEINMCAGVSGSVGFVVQSLEEAIERFAKKEIEEIKCKTCGENPCKCDENSSFEREMTEGKIVEESSKDKTLNSIGEDEKISVTEEKESVEKISKKKK